MVHLETWLEEIVLSSLSESIFEKVLFSLQAKNAFLKDLGSSLWSDFMEEDNVPTSQSLWEDRSLIYLLGHLAPSVKCPSSMKAHESLLSPWVRPTSKHRWPMIPSSQISEWVLIFFPYCSCLEQYLPAMFNFHAILFL